MSRCKFLYPQGTKYPHNNKKTKKRIKIYRDWGYVLPVKYLRNGERYPSSVFTGLNGKSHATNWYNNGSVVLIVLKILVVKNDEFSSFLMFPRCKISKFVERVRSNLILYLLFVSNEHSYYIEIDKIYF